jgi:uncharacterized oxidoreductase
MLLRNRTILITGGTSGIGLEFARVLRDRGNEIIVTGRDVAKLDAARRTVPGLATIESDVSDPDAIVRLHDEVVRRFPDLDTLMNNAGIMRNLDLTQPRDLEDVTREVDINLIGPIRMTQQFLAHLKTRRGALIINVSSGLAFVPMQIAPVYCATKAAMHSYTQSLRKQLTGTGVTAVELAPPGVETPLFRGEFAEVMKDQKGMDVKEFVRKAVDAIEKDSLEVRIGLSNVLKIMSRIAPQFMFNQLAKVSNPVR